PGGGIDRQRPYCENFDVLSHELGHSIIFSQVGVPQHPNDEAIDYGGMQESSGDLVAIVAVLHFDSVVNRLLAKTRGNLFTVNELDRVGELSDSRQIRIAFNYARMSDVGDEPHDRSLPLTGAIFDIMVEVFQKNLVRAQLITPELARRSSQESASADELAALQGQFDAAYAGHEAGFKQSLLDARDYLGRLLARTWGSLSPNFLTYPHIVRALLRADRAETQGAHQDTIRSCFAWRQIRVPRWILLAQMRGLTDCGLAARASDTGFSGLDDAAITDTIRLATRELEGRRARREPPGSAAAQGGGRR